MRDGIDNGIINATRLEIEDHGILVIIIDIEFEVGNQGYVVTLSPDNCYVAIRSLLEAIGVMRWEDLRGKACRVTRKDGLIEAIGHIYKNAWSKRIDLKILET